MREYARLPASRCDNRRRYADDDFFIAVLKRCILPLSYLDPFRPLRVEVEKKVEKR